ncbi:MAG: ribosome-associated translation inhibitor RaiA [Clostridiales bacterium]|nr:ribosome-associated translation inhibitor RaiA [Clostridiales bacterium]
MKITTIGRQMEVPAEIKALLEKKLAKFDKFFRDDAVAYVTLSRKRNKEILELTISSGGTLYRSEEENTTFNNALDEAMDSIERQIRKNKTRLGKRLRESAFYKEQEAAAAIPVIEEEPEYQIRVKSFNLRPMTPEEAILQMNLLGHEFFVFTNEATGDVNVVYRRKDNNYGMIVPSSN